MPEAGRMSGRVLLTGAAGFIGRAVGEGLRARGDRRVRLLVHDRAPDPPPPAGFEVVAADLARPGTLAGLCRGIETVLHVASYVGDDPERLEAVNLRGTEALVAEARAAGVRRFVYVSSAAVYGYAVHRYARETEVTIDPATSVSRSRAGAERAVLAAGGLVLRPLFVYGNGDTRFLPVIIRGLERIPFLIAGGRARLSVISVDDLAAAMIALADGRLTAPPAGAFHATDDHPVRFRDIAAALRRVLGVRRPRFSLPYFAARRVLGALGGPDFSDAGRASRAHRLFLVAKDHYYDSTKLWSLLGTGPGLPLTERLPAYADWYRRFLTVPGPGGRA